VYDASVKETRLMFVSNEVFLPLCELYPKSAAVIKDLALEKAKIKNKLF